MTVHPPTAMPSAPAPSSPPSPPFQILALDGGGVKGLFSAAILAAIEDDLKVSIAEHFDLIVGTSTGGIIALAIGAGIPPREIVEMYARMADRVFGGARRRMPLRVFRSKFDNSGLRLALVEAFGDRQLWQSRVPLVIPAYDLTRDRVHIFKTPHHERLRRDWRLPMVEVAMATSAAPTYFPAVAVDNVRVIDGGVWANNPVLVAIAEAVSMFGVRLNDIRVLSLGTTSDLVRRGRHLDRGGLLQWATSAAPLILRGQSIGADNTAFHLIGDRLVRIDEPVPANTLRLDCADTETLLGRAAAVSRDRMPAIESFRGHRAVPLQPLHRPG